jgi:NAD(P)-dependent dehydrogenase (short-subunit alcohol dehydrogenase family)
MTVPEAPTTDPTAERGVAVVTGAGRARGIGRAVARRLARDGFAVVVHERSGDPAGLTAAERAAGWRGAASVVDEITAAGGRALAVAGDVTERATADRLLAAARSLGDLAALVWNHGTAGEANAHVAHATPDDVWDDTVRVNLTSLQRLGSVLVPALATSPAAHRCLVLFSSTAGHRPLPRYGAYCATKAAVERLTEQQAVELARHGIRVNCVAPGLTPTDMIDGTLGRAADLSGIELDQVREQARRRIPLRRFATPEDIAAAVAFLTGPDAAYVTGQVLTVDGGMTLL